ncbi:MAG TPA: MFS transporter [Novosphingobium sp.]|nr:MFS transporter [Novosphingobium sp.]
MRGLGDFSEFRQHWKPLLAAFLGLGSALSLNAYLLSIFAPYLISEFGWSRSEWALLGMVQILIMVCLPVAGRLADLFGVRRVAAVGALAFPLFLMAITLMDGSIATYMAIYIAQTIICSTTTSTVYSRVVVQAFKVRRGIALGIAGSGPPLIGALLSPLVTAFVADYGWRAGYYAVAAFSLACAVGMIVLLRGPVGEGPRTASPGAPQPKGDYRAILSMPVFWLMLGGFFLVNLPFALATSQLKLVVIEQGLDDQTAALMVSLFAIGSIIGRVLSGVALDYLPSHLIAGVAFGLPVIGLAMLASDADTVLVVGTAILLCSISFGGEGDIAPYLVTQYFPIRVFSTVLGLMSAAMGASMASGNAVLAAFLARTDSFDGYLLTAAASAGIGAAIFLTLGARRFRQQAPGAKV